MVALFPRRILEQRKVCEKMTGHQKGSRRSFLVAFAVLSSFYLASGEDQCNATGPRKDCGACLPEVYWKPDWLLRS